MEGAEYVDDGTSHWYRGVLNKVTASGDFFIAYADESFGIVAKDFVREYEPYYVGETLEVLMEDDTIGDATIIADNGDGSYDVLLDEEEVRNVASGDIAD